MFSRKVMGFAVFRKVPASKDIQAFLERAFAAVVRKPKDLVTDRGRRFDCDDFKETWCERHGTTVRFGAVGRYGSIAVVERFNRTLKYEGLFLIPVPFSLDRMREESALIVEHYNHYRPHQGLNGRTPDEVYFDRKPANEKPHREPRSRLPRESPCAAPWAPVKGRRGVRLELVIAHLEGRRHLPIFRLKKAA